ncbi:copper chaperone PCu(A)C [Streptomyces sp. WMMB303]|uniref:copper chaperone PCu(A)C n=1 Tax=Streptomyces sp. WMMB303 TaxID=3034154 RepID=UPI0023EC0023|nr:copper chaperone PCu(A)C [Streptomyces sp. WMMB303]MDF4248805.1 copper chaperone PCu(A)C [Streptomyces sp. WMMB303]
MKATLLARLRGPVAAVATPVLACGLSLAGLGAWTAAGNAGSPPRLAVAEGHVYQRLGNTPETAAFFTITNTGGSPDRLLAVSSPRTKVPPALSRHRMTRSGAAYRWPVEDVVIPAEEGLTMDPHGTDVTVRPDGDWRLGRRIPFTLHFERGGPLTVLATVIRPGDRRN